MALTGKSLFLYNFEINQFNSSLDFKTVSGGPELQATLRTGYYSLSSLMREVARAMKAVDPANDFQVSADRTFSGGLQNRVTIGCNTSVFFSLLFSSGTRNASNCASILGYSVTDKTGSLSYLGQSTCGTILIPTFTGYTYLSPDFNQKQFGTVNVSASGQKEAIVFQTQRFTQIHFKYEPALKTLNEWIPFMQWATKQRLFEFTPQISDPNTFYEVTLESSSGDNKGLSYKINEMLPDFPNHYDIGAMLMRVNEV